MTDHPNAPTIPAPGLPRSVLPDDMAHNPAETFAIGQALAGLSEVDRYLKGRCDGVLAAAVAKMAADERKARDEFRAEVLTKLDAAKLERDEIKKMIADLGNQLIEYVDRVVQVDFKLREHVHSNDHCENTACEFRKLAQDLKAKEG